MIMLMIAVYYVVQKMKNMKKEKKLREEARRLAAQQQQYVTERKQHWKLRIAPQNPKTPLYSLNDVLNCFAKHDLNAKNHAVSSLASALAKEQNKQFSGILL